MAAAQPCLDCGIPLMPDTPIGSRDWQRFMVHDEVWLTAGLEPHAGWICVPDLETRLGRPLTGADLLPCRMNDPGRDDDTPRLAELKVAARSLALLKDANP